MHEVDILWVEGVTVARLEQPVDSLLPPVCVQLTGQVVQRFVPSKWNMVTCLHTSSYF